MADTKISALAQLTGVGSVADADEAVIVDKSDTSMAASGTTKRLTAADLAVAVFERPLAEFSTTTPAAPNVGSRLFTRVRGGRRRPAWQSALGVDSEVQASLAERAIALVKPQGNSNAVSSIAATLTVLGTATVATWATTSLHTQMRRVDYLVTTASTGAVAGIRGAAQQYWRGNGTPGQGGFFFVKRWAPATGQATATRRSFSGMAASTTAPGDSDPSTNLNIFGMGHDSADANWQFMHNDGAGVATKVDLGASFAKSSVDRADVFELAMFCPSGSSSALGGGPVNWQVSRLNTGAVASGVATTDLPANTTALNPWSYVSVGGTSSVIGLTLFSLYLETDF